MNYEKRLKVVNGISKLQEDKWLKFDMLVYQHFSTAVGDNKKCSKES